MKKREYRFPGKAFPHGEGKEEAASSPKKEANLASLRSAAPSKGRGSRGHSLLPMEGGAPKGRRLDGESGMKKSGGDHLKQAIYESTRAPLARSPFLNGEATIREYRFPHNVKANTRICGKRITTDKAFPSRGRCPEGADRALAAGKTDEESGTARHIWGKSESLGKDFSLRPK